jgi:hypothetical protein
LPDIPGWCQHIIESVNLLKPGYQPPKQGCENPNSFKEYPLTWNAVAGMMNPWQITQDEFMQNMYRRQNVIVQLDDFDDYNDYVLYTSIYDAFIKLVHVRNNTKFISIRNSIVTMKRNRDIDSIWRDYLVFDSELIEENANTGFMVRVFVLHNRKKKEIA